MHRPLLTTDAPRDMTWLYEIRPADYARLPLQIPLGCTRSVAHLCSATARGEILGTKVSHRFHQDAH